jgi:hypothetical protein
MRPDLHAPGPTILSELRHVDFGAALEGSNAEPRNRIIPKDRPVFFGLADKSIHCSLGDPALTHYTPHGKRLVSSLTGTWISSR